MDAADIEVLDVNIGSVSSTPFYCYSRSYFEPGEPATIPLNQEIHIIYGALDLEEICIEAEIPSGFLDTIPMNNIACGIIPEHTDIIEAEEIQIEIYPNPSQDFLNISAEYSTRAELRMYDIHGMNYSIKLGKNNISHLPAGCYFIESIDNHQFRKIKSFLKL